MFFDKLKICSKDRFLDPNLIYQSVKSTLPTDIYATNCHNGQEAYCNKNTSKTRAMC